MEALVARYDYDVRRLLLEGSQHDREVFSYLVPEVRSAYARTAAYEAQLCDIEAPK